MAHDSCAPLEANLECAAGSSGALLSEMGMFSVDGTGLCRTESFNMKKYLMNVYLIPLIWDHAHFTENLGKLSNWGKIKWGGD